ncbi:hypothetical protein H7X46_19170 [Pseudonocardia sp. C8]|uniref:hypothetical protein n=1 Tax=Pseudonocardia sp. C8 TaxID=2762759 RepID=UPI0016423AFA|nr:hypothetical protein [Pseudonocardia sp. C8]MBC3193184.1 hypothetical protein [Pseudonocardia sp. C8]
MIRLLRAVFRGLLVAVGGIAALCAVLAGSVLVDWVGRTYDIVWAVGALLALPLLGAAMTVYDQWTAGRPQRAPAGRRLGGA